MPQRSYFSPFAADLVRIVDEAKAHHSRSSSMIIEAAGYAYVLDVLTRIRGSMYDSLVATNRSPEDLGASEAAFAEAARVVDENSRGVLDRLHHARSGKFGADAAACEAALRYVTQIRASLDKHGGELAAHLRGL